MSHMVTSCFVFFFWRPSFSCVCFLSCMYTSSFVAVCMSTVVMHVGISVVLLMELMLMFMPAISPSLFPVWFCLDGWSVTYTSGPSLYMTCILYWWTLRRMHCSHWDRANTSFLKKVVCGLLLHFLLLQRNSDACPMLIYYILALHRLLLENAIDHRIVWSGALSLG